MKIKKILGVILTSVMMVSMIAGCGSSPEAESSSGQGDEKVTLKVLAGQSTTDAGIEDMIDEALAKKYPNIKLEWECVGWGGDFQAKMQQYMQTGMPDIIIGKAQDVGAYAPQGIFKEIDSTYTDRLLDAASDNVTIDGKTYGLVYNALYQGVYYNKDMFKENGWEVPKTQDDLKGKVVAAQNGSTAYATIDKDTKLKDSFKEFVGVEDNVKALMDLGVGGSDAVAMDTVVARYYMAKDPGKYSIIKDTTILDEKMGVGFRKGDNALCKKVEDTLKEMKKDGTLAKISKEWFGEDLTIIGEDK